MTAHVPLSGASVFLTTFLTKKEVSKVDDLENKEKIQEKSLNIRNPIPQEK